MNDEVGEGFRPPATNAPELLPRIYPRRRPNRLPLDVYRAGGEFFLTVRVGEGRRPFLSEQIVGQGLNILRCTADRFEIEIIEYCFMPDHLHLLIEAPCGIDVTVFMERFKQVSGFAFNRVLGSKGPFWQRSYYDHILRKHEDAEAVADYIRGNPIRAGLVSDAGMYPYSGSLVQEEKS